MKKIKSITLMLIVLLCITLNLGGCANHSAIPNGKYVAVNYQNKNVFVLKNSANEDDFYWEINYGMAQRCTSGIIDYKCKIIEDNGVLYFEGYTWNKIFSTKKMGSTTKYMVVYDDQSKSITVLALYEDK